MRLSGGGRKRTLEWASDEIKIFIDSERSYGHSVTKSDVFERYIDILTVRALNIRKAGKIGTCSPEEEAEARNMDDRISKLRAAPKYRQSFTEKLLLWCNAKCLRPHRVSMLSELEEQVRCHLTWKAFDFAQWLAAFGSAEELARFAAKPEQWMKHRSQTVLGFSDQVPLWAKCGAKKFVYAQHELKVTKQAALRASASELAALTDEQWAEKCKGAAEDKIEAALPQPHAQGQRQLRLQGHSEDERFRITYEASQVVRGWFAEGTPRGEVGRGLLVVNGVHCRLSNISASGTWLRDEAFTFKGKEVMRKAGASAGRLMMPWRRLRDVRPNLFESVSVMSQPAAFVDNIILSWTIEEHSKAFPQSVWQRDMFAAAFSQEAASAMFLAHELPCSIAAKMTAVLQLTDTDFAKTFKSRVRAKMNDLRASHVRKCRDQHTWQPFQAGVPEIMEAVVFGHEAMVAESAEKQWVLAGPMAKRLREMLVGWQVAWLAGRLVARLSAAWLAGCSVVCLVGFDWLNGWLAGRSVGWQGGWLAGWLISRLAGWSVG